MEKTTIIDLAKTITEQEKEIKYYKNLFFEANQKLEEAENKLREKAGRNREIEPKKEAF